MQERCDVVVVGGGIVGLAAARALLHQRPQTQLVVLEAEGRWGYHQSGHNSNVIHSGIYYAPGSMKARMARVGGEAMIRYCQSHGLGVNRTGKLIVASTASEVGALDSLAQRGRANGVHVQKISPKEARDLEPNIQSMGLSTYWIPQ